jgi:protocatechuate 3,4-dioxygenase beta subunit
MNTGALLTTVVSFLTLACTALPSAPFRTPPPAPGSTAIACNANESGKRLLIEGLVQDPAGRPIQGAIVASYNTDQNGLYNPKGVDTRVPRIQAKVITDADGRFQILTVFPGPYPEAQEPAHVHFDAVAPTYTLNYTTIWFEGDPLITPQKRAWAESDAETQIVSTRSIEGLTTVTAKIVLKPN